MESRNPNDDQAESVPAPHEGDYKEGAPGKTRDLREANENVRKAQGDDALDVPADPQKAGNKPRFDRDR